MIFAVNRRYSWPFHKLSICLTEMLVTVGSVISMFYYQLIKLLYIVAGVVSAYVIVYNGW